MDSRALGQLAEHIAADFLQTQGMKILLRNYTRRFGELDIIAQDPSSNVLIIAEVRTRGTADYGGAAASIDRWKQRKITRTALLLLQEHKNLARLPVRFDVIIVSDTRGRTPKVEWLKSAFEAAATESATT